MKKKFMLIIAMAMLCALPFVFKAKNINKTHAVTTAEETVVEEDSWTKEDTKEILGYIATGAGGVLTALLFAVPIYLKIRKAQNGIIEANTGITSERQNNESFAKRLEESESYLKKQEYEFHQALKANEEIIKEMSKELIAVKEICKLGFINNKELVSKGIATAISKVGQNEEHKE